MRKFKVGDVVEVTEEKYDGDGALHEGVYTIVKHRPDNEQWEWELTNGYCAKESWLTFCDLKSVRKATKKEVEEYLREKKDEKKDKISKLEEKMKEIQQEIEDLKNRV